MFRHFPILPHAVLSKRQQRLIDYMCSQQRFASILYVDGMDEAPVIGTVERRAVEPTQSFPPRRPVTRENRLTAEARQRP